MSHTGVYQLHQLIKWDRLLRASFGDTGYCVLCGHGQLPFPMDVRLLMASFTHGLSCFRVPPCHRLHRGMAWFSPCRLVRGLSRQNTSWAGHPVITTLVISSPDFSWGRFYNTKQLLSSRQCVEQFSYCPYHLSALHPFRTACRPWQILVWASLCPHSPHASCSEKDRSLPRALPEHSIPELPGSRPRGGPSPVPHPALLSSAHFSTVNSVFL